MGNDAAWHGQTLGEDDAGYVAPMPNEFVRGVVIIAEMVAQKLAGAVDYVDEITAGWTPGLEDFLKRRKPYLRYD